jgi:rhomboid protease GluP
MDINILLLQIVGAWCAVVLWQARVSWRSGWVWLAIGLIALGVGGWYAFPRSVGLVVGGVWFLLGLLPIVLLSRVNNFCDLQQWGKAASIAKIVALLHPADGLWQYPGYISALALGYSGDWEAAEARIDPRDATRFSVGRWSIMTLYRGAAEWEKLLGVLADWESRFNWQKEVYIKIYSLRAMGEIGEREVLLERWTDWRSDMGKEVEKMALLYLMAFFGDIDRTNALLATVFRGYPRENCLYWQGVALANSGSRDAAQEIWDDLYPEAPPTLKAAIVRQQQQKYLPLGDLGAAEELFQIATKMVDLQATKEMDSSFEKRRMPVTYFFIITIGIAFLLQLFVGNGTIKSWVLYRLGALVPAAVVIRGEWWRMVTANFLHGGWMHALMNVAGLYWLGETLEHRLGSWRFAFVYCFCGIGAMGVITYLGWDADPQTITIGASGAIMGLLGVAISTSLRQWLRDRSPAIGGEFKSLAAVAVVQLIVDRLTPQISVVGHAAGLFCGVLIGAAIGMKKNRQSS